MRESRWLTNPISVPAVKPSTLVEAAHKSAASKNQDRRLHWLNETCRATVVEERRIQKEVPFDNPPFETEMNEKIVLRRNELKTMIDVIVNSVATLMDDRVIFALPSCTAESQLSSVRAALLTTVAKVIDEQAGGENVVRTGWELGRSSSDWNTRNAKSCSQAHR